MKKVLITGITGFVGSHLAELLTDEGLQVFGTYRRHHLGDELTRIQHLIELGNIKLVECDLTSYVSIEKLLVEVGPDVVFHLAANSFVPSSWNDPSGIIQNNVQSTLNILEAVRRIKETGVDYNPVIHLACTSEQYGLVKVNEIPITENNPFRPLSPYAVSKITCEMLGYQYSQTYGHRTVMTRAFNHEGARRGKEFVISNFAYQIAKAEKAGYETMELLHGNLEAQRDFTHVSDVVIAYHDLVKAVIEEKIDIGEVFNVSSGESHNMFDVVDGLIKLAKIQVVPKQDSDRMRPSDVPILLGDSRKIFDAIGWKPTKDFNYILEDTLEYWRKEMNA